MERNTREPGFVQRFRNGIEREAARRGILGEYRQDAFVHAYLSALLTYTFGNVASKIAMDANEFVRDVSGTQTSNDLNMDLWNNREGRKIGDWLMGTSPLVIYDAIGDAVELKILDGSLITEPETDPRRFFGPPYFRPDFGVPTIPIPSVHGVLMLGDTIRHMIEGFSRAGRRPPESPLVLDLDGDGVKTVPLSFGGAYFDHGKDGFEEQTGWAAPDDGLLVRDLNGNGFIDDGTELFGNSTRLRSGATAVDGFQALTDLDSNGDGRISSLDSAWSSLRIWRDTNTDGVAAPEELQTLGAHGIASLSTASASSTYVDPNGHSHRKVGSYTRSDGVTRTMTDVWFQVNPTFSMYSEVLAVPTDVAALPYVEGFGLVYDMHQAIVRDTSGGSRALVASFGTEADTSRRTQLVDQILSKWTGSDGVVAGSRGPNFDAKRLAVLEKFLGYPFVGAAGPNPGAGEPTELLNDAYRMLHELVHAQLMLQTHAREEYSRVSLFYDETTKDVRLDWSAAVTYLQNAIASNPAAGEARLAAFARAMAGVGAESLGYWNFREQMAGTNDRLAWLMDTAARPIISGTSGADTLTGNGLANALAGGHGNDTLDARAGSDVLHGQNGDDTLRGGTGRDLLAGGAGNDALWGEHDDDVLDGGLGNDTLRGGEGNDTYLFARGGGIDTIDDWDPLNPTNFDTLRFGRTVRPADVTVTPRSSDDLILKINGTTDEVRVVRGIDDWSDASAVEEVRFADGTAWSLDTLKEKSLTGTAAGETIRGFESRPNTINGNSGNDTIYDGPLADVVFGGAGNDIIHSGDGADTITGGTGNDTINGGRGNDLYKFAKGDGQDVINDSDATAGNIDTLELAKGIQTYDVQVLPRVNNDLVLRVGTSGDQIRVVNGLHDASNQNLVERIRFAQNNTVWDVPTIFQKALTGTAAGETIRGMVYRDNTIRGLGGDDTLYDGIYNDVLEGGDGNDTLWSGDGNDVLDGGPGNDALNSGRGNDTFKFDRGYGQDRIDDNDATTGNVDTITFGSTVTPLNLIFQRQVNDLKIAVQGTADAVTVSGWYASTARQTEILRSGDGRSLRNTQVDGLIQAMASFSQSSGLTWDQAIVQQPQSVAAILAAHWSQQ